ncbi:glycosyltransferase family 1 protein [soil metagenome]
MRIAIDATPAAVQRGGVGRYTRELVRALVQETLDHSFVLSAAARSAEADGLLASLPPGAWRELRRLPARERLMTAMWQRARLPVSIEQWIGPHDVFHGADFALPPTRARTVVTVHDFSFLLHPEYCHPDLGRYLRNVVPRSVNRADVVITVSASVAAEFASIFPGVREKVVAIPNGFAAPPDRGKPSLSGPPTVLMVGTIEPRKNHRTVIRAMAGVRDALPDARLVVVGRRGWLDDEIVAEIETGRRAGWLDWMENANDRDLENVYRAATVFVAASHYEGFGLPVLEAMSHGVPCIVSDIPAHREVGGDAAIYVHPTEVDAFADSIIRLLTDDDARGQLACAGPERATGYSWQETARRTLRAYELAASGSR